MNYRLTDTVCRVACALFLLFAALPALTASPPIDNARQGLPTLAPLVNEVTPAVVNISVITRSPLEDNPLFRDPYFRRFFNLPDRPQRREQASGSGVIVDAARGYVLTNHHVIKDAEQAIVTRSRELIESQPIASKAGEIDAIPGLRPWTDDFNNLFQILK